MKRQYILVFILLLMLLFIFSREGMEADAAAVEAKINEKQQVSTYIKSMREGMIRGGLTSLIFGGYEGMIGNIVSQGIVNPIMKYME